MNDDRLLVFVVDIAGLLLLCGALGCFGLALIAAYWAINHDPDETTT